MYYQLSKSGNISDLNKIPSDATILDLSNSCLMRERSAEEIIDALKKAPQSLFCLCLGHSFIGSSPVDKAVAILKALPENITTLDLSYSFNSLRSTEELMQIVQAIPKQITTVNFCNNLLRTRSKDELLKILEAFPSTLKALDLRFNYLEKELEGTLFTDLQVLLSPIQTVLLRNTGAREKMLPEMRLLELMGPLQDAGQYAELIVALEFNLNKSSHEELLLQLLLDPSTRDTASIIMELLEKPDKTAQDHRKLQLLLDPYTRKYADKIILLEEKMLVDALSEEEEKDLSIYYLGQIIGQDLRKDHIIVHSLRQVAPSIFFDPGSSHALQRTLLKTIERTIDSSAHALLEHYFLVNRVPKTLQTTAPLQAYALDKKQLLRLSLKKYFTGTEAPDFNETNLETLVSNLKHAFSSRTLSLSDKSAFLDLECHLPQDPSSRTRYQIAL